MTNQKERRKVPELRFPEFSGEWEEKELSELAYINDGTHNTPTYVESGIPFFSVENVTKKDFTNSKFVTFEAYENYKKRIDIEYHDILMTRIGSIGDVKLVDWTFPSTFYVSLALIKPYNKNSSKFLSYVIQSKSVQREIYNKSLVTAIPQKINLIDLKKVRLNISTILDEQQKIGEFFSKLDRQIELEEKKLALLEEQKKGYMQKIFSQELRFKGENGEEYPEWEVKKISDILKSKKREIAKPTKSYIRLGLRSHGKGTFYEKVEDPSKVAMDKLYLVKENDFIINITFAWEQALAIAEKPDENKLVSHRFPTFIFNENYGIEFFKHYFLGKRFKYLLNVSSPGGAGRNKVLNISQFNNIELKVPCYKEQLKIGSFITLLTENIKKQTIKIENLRKRKSNFLERSFI